jgi:hypothetical protein
VRHLGVELILQLLDGTDSGESLTGGQGGQRREGERGDAQEDELAGRGRIQAGPPPSSSRRCMK